jgi:hypothetical protein
VKKVSRFPINYPHLNLWSMWNNMYTL